MTSTTGKTTQSKSDDTAQTQGSMNPWQTPKHRDRCLSPPTPPKQARVLRSIRHATPASLYLRKYLIKQLSARPLLFQLPRPRPCPGYSLSFVQTQCGFMTVQARSTLSSSLSYATLLYPRVPGQAMHLLHSVRTPSKRTPTHGRSPTSEPSTTTPGLSNYPVSLETLQARNSIQIPSSAVHC